jgi:hypothetical protein
MPHIEVFFFMFVYLVTFGLCLYGIYKLLPFVDENNSNDKWF